MTCVSSYIIFVKLCKAKIKQTNSKNNKEIILGILKKLEESDYIDPAEHLYDGIKSIKRHLDDSDLDKYIYI